VDSDQDQLLTLDEVAAELRISREALYRWRRRGTGPPSIRLPGGTVRIRRSALTAWLRTLQDKETAA
jgi:excisionase family DNA binding protein